MPNVCGGTCIEAPRWGTACLRGLWKAGCGASNGPTPPSANVSDLTSETFTFVLAPAGRFLADQAAYLLPGGQRLRPSGRLLAFAVSALGLFAGCVGTTPDPTPVGTPPGLLSPPVKLEAIRFDTEVGPLVVILYPEAAPKTVELMRTYVRENYYVGREFNRAVPGHVIQITDKAGGVTDDLRTVPLEPHPEYHFGAGALGIARSDDPNSGGPEFFIMDFATSHLDGNYTVWGQVVQGLDVVHKAARVEAVQAPRLPPPAPAYLLFDRLAVDAVAINRAELTSVTLTGEEAERYPMKVAKNLRAGEYRHSMDWPRNLRAGMTSDFTWYVFAYNNTSPPEPARVSIQIDSQVLPVTGEPTALGVYRWKWTPPSPGAHDATLTFQGQALATLQILVPQ